jgi:hypothetical protein
MDERAYCPIHDFAGALVVEAADAPEYDERFNTEQKRVASH